MQIIIGADIVPTESNLELFTKGDIRTLLGDELIDILKSADFRMFNLEAPLTDKLTPIRKCGENLAAPSQCVNALKSMKIDLVTLSNNHIMDQGEQGLTSTIRVLDNAGIDYVGVGKTQDEAAKPYIFKCDNKEIGVYACAEHESSIVTKKSAGANPLDLLESFDHVSSLKKKCDYVIVLFHGGKEHYRYPSPYLQRVCRKLVEKGADLVVCQHSHCIGAEEVYKNKTIVYGQGNFLFDGSESEYWQTSVLLRVNDEFKIDYIPLQKCNNVIRLADLNNGDQILNGLMERSQSIKNADCLESLYEEFAYQYVTDFLTIASGRKFSWPIRAINKFIGKNKVKRGIIEKKYTVNKCITLLNRVTCESNAELFATGLEASIKKRV